GAWVLRAVTVPVAGPVEGTWPELREALKSCWRASTRLANWCVAELYRSEPPRAAGDEKMPPMTRRYLYPEARAMAPEMDATSVTSLLRSVEARYAARRLAAIWRRSEALPSYRYPVPYPIHNQAWSLERGEGGEWIVSARLGGQRRRLRLRGGRAFARQHGQPAAAPRAGLPNSDLACHTRTAPSRVPAHDS